jgi:hypothetical protein
LCSSSSSILEFIKSLFFPEACNGIVYLCAYLRFLCINPCNDEQIKNYHAKICVNLIFSKSNVVVSLHLFSFLCIARLPTVFYLHAFPCNCSCSRCSRKIAESLQTLEPLPFRLWVLHSIHTAPLPSHFRSLH